MNYKHSQKGISLMFAIFILTFSLGIALGTATILVRQIKIMREIGYSVIAFYAADSGIEDVLMNRESPSSSCTEAANPCLLDYGADYYIDITSAGGDCSADNYCITSIGSYKNTSRAIEISY